MKSFSMGTHRALPFLGMLSMALRDVHLSQYMKGCCIYILSSELPWKAGLAGGEGRRVQPGHPGSKTQRDILLWEREVLEM